MLFCSSMGHVREIKDVRRNRCSVSWCVSPSVGRCAVFYGEIIVRAHGMPKGPHRSFQQGDVDFSRKVVYITPNRRDSKPEIKAMSRCFQSSAWQFCFALHSYHMSTQILFPLYTIRVLAEALMAYISIQPELIQELVDLVRVRTDRSAQRRVPLDISVLAVHCLAALVHTRCEASLGHMAVLLQRFARLHDIFTRFLNSILKTSKEQITTVKLLFVRGRTCGSGVGCKGLLTFASDARMPLCMCLRYAHALVHVFLSFL